jgi:hypothetical protein
MCKFSIRGQFEEVMYSSWCNFYAYSTVGLVH